LNKQDAFDRSMSETTVKAQRGRVMRRMLAQSLVDLAEMAMKLRLGQMSRLFGADPIAGRDDYASKVLQTVLLRAKLQLCLARWSIIVGSPVGEQPMDQWPGDLCGCLA
jgi:Bacterial regulatory proteins, luxR family